MTVEITVGIDPGWKNLGISILKIEDGNASLFKTGVLNPSESKEKYGSRWGFYKDLDDWLGGFNYVDYVGIERYVAYKGIDTAESENIVTVIGMLGDYFYRGSLCTNIHLYKAFDWKKQLCQHLVKTKNFTNPSSSFDKKYSIAAAKACLDVPYEFQNDHQADSVAIAFTNLLQASSSRS